MRKDFRRHPNMPDATAKAVLQRLRRSGELEVVLNVIHDHADWLDKALRHSLESDLLTDAKVLAGFQAVQGAVCEMRRMADIVWCLGDPTEPAPIKRLRGTVPPPMRTAS